MQNQEHSRKPIAKATDDELRDFCLNVLQIPVHHNAGKEKILAKMSVAWTQDFITIPPAGLGAEASAGTPPPPPDGFVVPEPIAAAGKTPAADDPKVTIIIQAQEGEGGDRPVSVGHNGSFMLIERAKEQIIPYRYYLVLKDANETKYEEGEDEGVYVERTMQSYPFNVVRGPTQEEVDAWHRKQIEDDRKAAA